jgi:hypothetical protein
VNTFGKIAAWGAGGLVALAGIGWMGLQVPPRIFPPILDESQNLGTVQIPADLPAPVRRYVQVAFDDQIPQVDSMVAWGRARANFGLWMPLRFRLYHRPGHDFRRDMEVTWFGLPVLKAVDQYLNGHGMTGPVGSAETGAKVDQGANLILWAEASLMPSLLVSDPRIRWEAIDATSARLIFPFDDQQDEMVFHFDPQTGLITRTTALRYRGAEGEKVAWYAETLAWQTVNGVKLPARVAITWEDEGKPWSSWDFEGVVWNVDISQQLPVAPTAAVAQPEAAVSKPNHVTRLWSLPAADANGKRGW